MPTKHKEAEQEAEEGFVRSRGMRFPKDPEVITNRLRRSLRTDTYERKEAEAVLRTVRDGDRVIELGAGIGYMSTFVAKKREVVSVHAFEANPGLIPYIEKVHRLNDLSNVHVRHGILGDADGEVDFYVRGNILGSSLTVLENEDPPEPTTVPVHDHKRIWKELKPNLLICDIEGAEAELIPKLDLSEMRAAIIELHPQWIGTTGVNKVFQAFMDAGLAYYHRGSTNKVVAFRNRW
ncbi:MAG: FkbM family methyltransferase [Sulfitobacter sp.]|nr:FkbM family methyltransferase [Sulfitobacter sp.]